MRSPATPWTRWLAYGLALLLLAVVGMYMLKIGTPYGLGLVNDSAAYVGGAESLLGGDGYVRLSGGGEVRPITHFPPLFSMVLAGAGWIGLDLLLGARIEVVLLFGAGILLTGLVALKLTRSQAWSLFCAALFTFSDAMLVTHSRLLSEPLYLALSLLVLLLVAAYFDSGRGIWLVASGGALGLCYLTRYAAISLAVALLGALLVLEGRRERRLRSMTLVLAGFAPPVLAWLWRNTALTGTATNRTLYWHPIPTGQLTLGMQEIMAWLRPDGLGSTQAIVNALFGVLAWVALVATVAALLYAWRHAPKADAAAAIGWTLGLFIPAYLLFLVASMSLFDASTPMDTRILAPVYLALMLLSVALLSWLWSKGNRASRGSALLLGALALSISLRDAAATVHTLQRDGAGFASLSWKNSRTVDAVRNLSASVVIYSNRPTGIMLTTDRTSYIAPTPIDPVTLRPRAEYAADVRDMQGRILGGEAVLVLFHFGSLETLDDPEWVEELTRHLPIQAEFNDGTIFGLEAR